MRTRYIIKLQEKITIFRLKFGFPYLPDPGPMAGMYEWFRVNSGTK